jgi:glycogen debranching enzyme
MVRNEGVNSNTSYALTFVKWLKNMYMFTGDKTLLEDCLEGVKAAINKYISYLGENNLVETPRNYVFLDWLFVDGINLFSPSKNLGQSVATITLYDSIRCAEYIYNELGLNKESKKLHSIANKIKKAINTLLFNKEKGLYCEGLTTPNIPNDKYVHVPDNFDKTYYRKHANILAVAYDVVNKSTSKKILHKLFFGEIKDFA